MLRWLPSSQFLRFLVIGALNSLFGFAFFSGLILLGASTWTALIGGNIAGSVFNFFTNGHLVFRDLSLSRAPRFLLCYAAVLGINAGLIDLLAPIVDNRIIAQAILTAPMALFSYLLMTKFVFRVSA